jgi:hypothetical protein
VAQPFLISLTQLTNRGRHYPRHISIEITTLSRASFLFKSSWGTYKAWDIKTMDVVLFSPVEYFWVRSTLVNSAHSKCQRAQVKLAWEYIHVEVGECLFEALCPNICHHTEIRLAHKLGKCQWFYVNKSPSLPYLLSQHIYTVVYNLVSAALHSASRG